MKEENKKYGQEAYAIVEHAANVIGPRLPGSEGEKKYAEYMADQMEQIGVKSHTDKFFVAPRSAIGGLPYAGWAGVIISLGAYLALKAPSLWILLACFSIIVIFWLISCCFLYSKWSDMFFRRRVSRNVYGSVEPEDGKVDFEKDFFNKPTNLTVSGQLNGETYAMAFKNIYTFGPTFRAENSNTTRHAAEFWMIEPEIAFADLKDDMILAESMIKYIINYVLENAPEEMEFFNNFVDKGLIERLKHVANSEFGHVTYTEAIELLEKNNDKFDYKVSWGCDLQTEHERYLTEEIFKKPVFVTDYPKEIKAFYMKLNEDGKTVAAMDCLVPGIGEIIGGSQREDNYDLLLARMEELGLKKEDYDFYLDLRKYGSARHAGFGLGFERCVMYMTGMGNIRDVIPFPRTVNNCEL